MQFFRVFERQKVRAKHKFVKDIALRKELTFTANKQALNLSFDYLF